MSLKECFLKSIKIIKWTLANLQNAWFYDFHLFLALKGSLAW